MKPNAKNVVSAEADSVWARVRERKGPRVLAPRSSQEPGSPQLPGTPRPGARVPYPQPDKVLGEGQSEAGVDLTRPH